MILYLEHMDTSAQSSNKIIAPLLDGLYRVYWLFWQVILKHLNDCLVIEILFSTWLLLYTFQKIHNFQSVIDHYDLQKHGSFWEHKNIDFIHEYYWKCLIATLQSKHTDTGLVINCKKYIDSIENIIKFQILKDSFQWCDSLWSLWSYNDSKFDYVLVLLLHVASLCYLYK